MTARKLSLVIMTCFAISFISCDVDVPIKEMVKAKSTIQKAQTVMAEKYDPDNLAKAVDWLKKSHEYLVGKDAKNAKSAAEKSIVYGDLALQTTLPKVTEETLSDAKTVYGEADKLNAGQFAPEKFSQAGSAIGEAEKLKSEDKLWDAYLKAKEAVAAGNDAKETCLGKIPGLNEELGKMKKDISVLESLKLSAQQKKELSAASTNLDKAGVLITQNNVKDAVPLMADSGKTVNKLNAETGKLSAKERIAQLRREADQLKKKRGSEFAGEDIEVVMSTLNEADALLEQDKLEEANKKIADAESSLAIAKEKTTKGLALDKAKSVEKLLEEVRKNDTQNKYKTETDNAAEMIADGKKLIEKESYRDSLLKFEEAEKLLYSLGVVKEKDTLKESGAVDTEGKKVYKVIYNRKKRDCLWRIAGKVYNNARLWPLIYMANKDQIKDPDLIFPGQKFVIPEVPKKNENKKEKQETSAIREEKKAAEEKGSADVKEPSKNQPDTTTEDKTEEEMTE
jgi:nucleoid-associated protein YgaU